MWKKKHWIFDSFQSILVYVLNFITGESILIINIQKLFNGKSVFGMRTSGNIQLDYILIDDVHACVDDVKAQFMIKVTRDSNIAKQLFAL